MGGGGVLALLLCIAIALTVVNAHQTKPGLRGVTLRLAASQADLLRGATSFLERCAGPGESVFVAADLAVLYFTSGRPPGTRYLLTIPGNVDAMQLVDDLRDHEVACVVYSPDMYIELPPFRDLFPEVWILSSRPST